MEEVTVDGKRECAPERLGGPTARKLNCPMPDLAAVLVSALAVSEPK